MDGMPFRLFGIFFLVAWFASVPCIAAQLGDLPGEDVSSGEIRKSEDRVRIEEPSQRRANWLAAPVEEQLARERTLIPLGKGAIFVPSYSEPRREPEVTVTTLGGKPVKTGSTGERILVDSGTYTVRLGSGTNVQQFPVDVNVEEGHTTVIPPEWGGLIVETLTGDGKYVEGQYEVIRMGKWVNYGRGRGLTEERLQDIKTWLLPPGMYRISKPGEGFNSLRNYITVQINPGELSQIELIYDKEIGGDIVSGGAKSLNARVQVGSNWTLGLRAGGNVNLTRETDKAGIRKEVGQVQDDLRLRLQFDNVLYLGLTELFLQDNFSKERGRPLSVTSDIAELRTNWIRRLTPWLGPYVRTIVETHLFEKTADNDSVYVARFEDSSGVQVRRIVLDTTRHFLVEPALDPVNFKEGLGVNVELVSKYYLEASTQMGLAARQTIVDFSYVPNLAGEYERAKSTYEIGGEGTLNGTLRLGSEMALDLRLELFAPNANPSRLRLDDLTADFRFFLSRNLEIGYLYQVKENVEKSKNRYPSSHNLSLRLSFNY
jgi:hypothetical protein